MYFCSSCIERCVSIDLTWIFRANTVATAKHRVFYDSAATAITWKNTVVTTAILEK